LYDDDYFWNSNKKEDKNKVTTITIGKKRNVTFKSKSGTSKTGSEKKVMKFKKT